MKFTYRAYAKLIDNLRTYGYKFCDYKNWENKDCAVILRHDIDYDVKKAIKIAELEAEKGVNSTYFVLVSSDFYNIFSKNTCESLKKVADLGHTIGLHFDEARYEDCEGNIDAVVNHITDEAQLLNKAIGASVDSVSMHRPSRSLLEADIHIPGMINSYGQMFFKEFKYLSDSRRRWREPIDEIICSRKYRKLHILTHTFWYHDREETLDETVKDFVFRGNCNRYDILLDNITGLNKIIHREELINT